MKGTFREEGEDTAEFNVDTKLSFRGHSGRIWESKKSERFHYLRRGREQYENSEIMINERFR